MNFVSNSRKALLAGVAMTACLGFAFNAQAQTCTTTNWAGGITGSPTVGKQDGDNRRYGGPCGMRAPLDGAPHYVSDNSPGAEPVYISRFYVFLENPGTGPITLFEADDGTNPQVQVVFESGAIVLSVKDQGGTWHDIPSGGVSVDAGSWHSVELVWEDAADAQIALSVDGAADVTPGSVIDTTGIAIENAHLGNLNGASGGGLVDFDDFDSRRVDRPGLLMVGDANDDGSMGVGDLVGILSEMNDVEFAPGQPDCNEDGEVAVGDLVCVLSILNS